MSCRLYQCHNPFSYFLVVSTRNLYISIEVETISSL
nr:MAG TPA: peptidase [Caudoviricetes sp.]